MAEEEKKAAPVNFIRQIIDADLASGKVDHVVTRFPPEPNGYLHIGHAKSICLNFGIAQDYHGKCNLRFDDTNPAKEGQEYVDSIKRDVEWLGFKWDGEPHFSSDYFDRLYGFAIELINKGLAYVDELSPDEIREYRGTLTEPGKNSPYRDRSVEENLALFEKMKNGEFAEGKACLRAKIDMASSFMCMRDPVIYRIKFAEHHRTGKKWCIYPMYDFTHCLSDAIEGITHSICTLEFQDNRRLYDWVIEHVPPEPAPSVRVQPPQPRVLPHLEEKAQSPCDQRHCGRLGRSPPCHHLRHEEKRLHSGCHPRVLQKDWRNEAGQHRRDFRS